MSSDVQPAASSAAVESAPVPSLDSLTETERATWQRTGEFPEAATKTDAASSPADPAAQELSTESHPPPASEPGTPAKPKKNAESRIQELLAERAALRAQLDAATRPIEAPRQTAPVTSEKFPNYETWFPAQPEDAPREYEDYLVTRAKYEVRQEQQAEQAQRAAEAAQRTEAERLAAYRTSAESFVQAHPDYWTVIHPITQSPVTPVTDAIGKAITASPIAPQLLYHLGQHRDVFDRLLSLGEIPAIYELGKLEATLTAPAPPNPKTLSTAPAPPPTLGSKPATPVDDVDAAVRSGDYATYAAAMNRRQLAAR